MPQPFHPLSLAEFGALVARFPFTRRIDSVHVRQSRHPVTCGEDMAGVLARQHRADVERRGWTDIGQHATVAPDGTIWTGRSWNRPPCSMAGQNGNRERGPFLIEVLTGDGGDSLDGPHDALCGAIAYVQRRVGLAVDAIRLTSRQPTAPPALLDKVRRHRDELERDDRSSRPTIDRPFAENARAYVAALATLVDHPVPPFDEPSWAEDRDALQPLPSPVRAARRALCVGVDRYPTAPLLGCVADARLWKATFDDLGFETELLLDDAATREHILSRLGALVAGARPGDVVAFQFSGHGTQVPDDSADETDRKDEAMCPVDFASGRLLLDDDVGLVLATIPEGVNVTLFIDCCHSGTISRFSVRPPVPEGAGVRFVAANDTLVEAHRTFRAGLPRATRAARPRMREVLFAACQPWELAWESQGQGDFTRKAVRRLREAAGQVTHEEFVQQVTAAFGPAPRQHPLLTCAPAARAHVLLAPLVVGA